MKLVRIADVDGVRLNVPPYVNRTVSGWQVRVRGVASEHFADLHYGSAAESLSAAARAVEQHLAERLQREKLAAK
ncbi:hypothetical protein [Paracidovorax wautersii]|uniref:hypothetical protein n=1 Tax=Paracidovorax wautersii TaxID=1177982 RepID=UPI001113B96D|nr:hypothetical protein [Paracidovorax wautersii]